MTEFVISVLLAVAPSLFPQIEDWLYSPPDTPAADVVLIKPPYALVKHHSKGPNPLTELVGPCPVPVPFECGIPRYSAQVAGRTMVTECDDAERTALSGDWLVIQDRMGRYSAFDLSDRHTSRPSDSSLDSVNAHLAQHGVGPASDADFRTFEQWAEERDRLRTTRSLAVLSAVTLGWLAVAGVVFWFRRRMT